MKTMTCKQLGGVCDQTFSAETFEQMAEQSKQHGMQMFAEQDQAHLAAMQQMQQMMQEPGAMEAWYKRKRIEFEALPTD